jgi:hypothetical protein
MFQKARVNWGKGTVENYGRKFEGVEVSTAAAHISAQPASTKDEGAKRRVGRQSKEEEIAAAIKGLTAAGVDLQRLPRKEAYSRIKDYARTKLQANTDVGYSEAVLQRTLLRTFGPRT